MLKKKVWKANKGFSLIEVLMCLMLLGIISVTFIPINTSTNNNIKRCYRKMEMKYLAEDIIENIKSEALFENNDYNLFDMPIEKLIEKFKKDENVFIVLPENNSKSYDYNVYIHKKNLNNYLWEIDVDVLYEINKNEPLKISYKSYIPLSMYNNFK